MTSSEELAACYRQLDLSTDADLEALDSAYFQLRGQMICAGQRQALEPLKSAYHKIKKHLLADVNRSVSAAGHEPTRQSRKDHTDVAQSFKPHHITYQASQTSPAEKLTAALTEIGLATKLSIRQQTLHLGVIVQSNDIKNQITQQIYALLSQSNLAEYGLSEVEIVRVYGLSDGKTAAWKTTFPMPNVQATADDADLFSFDNRISNAVIFPGLLLFAALLNSIEGIRLLLFGIVIWIHEFGHATVAWLCGYRAIPLPFGWTNTSLEKSLFVYCGVLTLLGLLFWTGQKEQRKWPMVLAAILAAVQFLGTWVISDNTYDLLLSFGGVGGEFYLSTLLIVSFYFPLPAQWRWDFYRYPAVLGAGFVFLGSAWRWQKIESGLQAIPWGTLLGGSGDMGGDMNRLVGHGWSDQQIINTYNGLGGLCVVVIASVYLYFFLKQRNHLFLYAKWKQYQRS
ncbi:MAG: hypothetical protein AAF703_09105 [Cyanobacteria bacterium P01_D01_bin.105]